jgi:hypothetical protein
MGGTVHSDRRHIYTLLHTSRYIYLGRGRDRCEVGRGAIGVHACSRSGGHFKYTRLSGGKEPPLISLFWLMSKAIPNYTIITVRK